MKCCLNCFADGQIQEIITKLADIGDCDFCGSHNVPTYPIGQGNEIEELLESVIDLYDEVKEAETEGKILSNALREDWAIFAVNAQITQQLLLALCSSRISNDENELQPRWAIPQLADADFLKEYGLVKGHSWSSFSDSVKYENRFHSGVFNSDAFATYLSYAVRKCQRGEFLFRARICTEPRPLPIAEMGAPPLKKRAAGRISPEGVGVLYLASDEVTALNEIRASTYDFVSIGRFELMRDVTIVDLSKMTEISPFINTIDLAQYAANKEILSEISREIAKPLRRSDSPLEYLPTQYISEFIKSQGYRGVRFMSTMNTEGYNLALFDDGHLEDRIRCIDVELLEVEKIHYTTSLFID